MSSSQMLAGLDVAYGSALIVQQPPSPRHPPPGRWADFRRSQRMMAVFTQMWNFELLAFDYQAAKNRQET